MDCCLILDSFQKKQPDARTHGCRPVTAGMRRQAQITFFAPFIFHPQHSLTTAPLLDKCRQGCLYLPAIRDVVTKQLCLVAVRIFKEYQRGAVFRLGRFVSFRGPALSFIIPFIEKMVRGDLPTLTLNVSP
jgi:hypothetical protein